MIPNPDPIRELDGSDVRHCTTAFAGTERIAITEIETLPFHDLGGAGLERLCYELLLAQRYEPRFFGRPGQAQYGVDLVAQRAGRTEVYQCKNLSIAPSGKTLQGYLNAFEKEWLGDAGLPRPERFVICCPQPLRDSALDADWMRAKQSFEQRTGVEAVLWDRDLLIGWLRDLPDVVADLFSNRHAEVFCDLHDWGSDLFRPLRDGASGDRRIRRYFESRRRGRIYVDEDRATTVLEALERSPVILVRGLPGTGKTFTTFAVTEGLAGVTRRRYFVDVDSDEFSKARLREGIRVRAARPSVFILENCHEHIDAVGEALADLAPLLDSRRVLVICLARRVPTSLESRSDDSEFPFELASVGAVVDFENNDALLRRVAAFWRPELAKLSDKRLSKLAALCGRDLYLLDEVVTLIASASEIDTLSPASVFEMVRRAYLGYKTAHEFPLTRRLAALAQFEVHPRADVLKLPEEELARLEGFWVRAGQPPRWHFLHSTAAELVLHALWSGMGVTEPSDIAREAAADIIEYFRDLQRAGVRPPVTPATLVADLLHVVNNRLKLLERKAQEGLKAAVLDSEPVQRAIAALTSSPEYPGTILRCARVANLTGAATAKDYARRLLDAITKLLERGESEEPGGVLRQAARMLLELEQAAPELHAELDQKALSARLLDLIDEKATIVDFVQVVQGVSRGLARGLVEAVDEQQLDWLTENTVVSNRSVGTLGLILRESQRKGPSEISATLMEKIGARRFLRVIEAKGSILELFKVIEYVPPTVARALIERLDGDGLDRLVERTIETRRSVGTLDFTLRELRDRKETHQISEALEQKIGPARLLRLIEANGTLFELFRAIQHASSRLASKLVNGLDDAFVERLVDKTIHARRSIGTLDWTLRGLRNRKETKRIGEELESRIGVSRFLRLIEANGTLFELFMTIRHASASFARELVDALNEDLIGRLTDKTIAAQRSIGTLNLTFRTLRGRTVTADAARILETKIGAARFWKLVVGAGSPGPLVDLLSDVTPEFVEQIVRSARELTIDDWTRVIMHGSFYELCEIIPRASMLLGDATCGPRLVAAIEERVPDSIKHCNWYERNTGAALVAANRESRAAPAVSGALQSFLMQIDPATLSFDSLGEATNAIDLLHRERPELRPALARALRTLLPPREELVIDPTKDFGAVRLLLRLLSQPDFSDDDAFHFAQGVVDRLTPPLIRKIGTMGLLWTICGLLGLERARLGSGGAFGQSLPPALRRDLRNALVARAAQKGSREELRAQFGLAGVLSLVGESLDAATIDALRVRLAPYPEAAWWLCADLKFVFAGLILRGLETVKPLPAAQRGQFQQRLSEAASELHDLDTVGAYLYEELLENQNAE